MIRAAAKNHLHVAVVVDPEDYKTLITQSAADKQDQQAIDFRRQMAWKAFQVISIRE